MRDFSCESEIIVEDYITVVYVLDSYDDLSNMGIRLKEDTFQLWIHLNVSVHALRGTSRIKFQQVYVIYHNWIDLA